MMKAELRAPGWSWVDLRVQRPRLLPSSHRGPRFLHSPSLAALMQECREWNRGPTAHAPARRRERRLSPGGRVAFPGWPRVRGRV